MSELKEMLRDYTTPEQSERLIKLGLPIKTANCVRVNRTGMVFFVADGGTVEDYIRVYNEERHEAASPCWTAGRLLELTFMFCEGAKRENDVTIEEYGWRNGIIESLIQSLEIVKEKLDFTKLEKEKTNTPYVVFKFDGWKKEDLVAICDSMKTAKEFIRDDCELYITKINKKRIIEKCTLEILDASAVHEIWFKYCRLGSLIMHRKFEYTIINKNTYTRNKHE